MKARPAVKRGMALGLELRQGIDMKDPKVQAVLFNQRARTVESSLRDVEDLSVVMRGLDHASMMRSALAAVGAMTPTSSG